MLSNMLNDLAEAMKALDGKKCVFCLVWFGCGCVCFVCLVAFVFGLCFFLDGTAHWIAYRLLITRAIRLLTAATIRPAHARPPHPTWVTAVRHIFRCYHPQGKLLFLRACSPEHVTVPVPDGIRDVDVLRFSAGSYTGLAIHKLCSTNLTVSRAPLR